MRQLGEFTGFGFRMSRFIQRVVLQPRLPLGILDLSPQNINEALAVNTLKVFFSDFMPFLGIHPLHGEATEGRRLWLWCVSHYPVRLGSWLGTNHISVLVVTLTGSCPWKQPALCRLKG